MVYLLVQTCGIYFLNIFRTTATYSTTWQCRLNYFLLFAPRRLYYILWFFMPPLPPQPPAMALNSFLSSACQTCRFQRQRDAHTAHTASRVVTDFSSAPSPLSAAAAAAVATHAFILFQSRSGARALDIRPAAKDNDQVLCSPNRRSSSSSCSPSQLSRFLRIFIIPHYTHRHRAIIFGLGSLEVFSLAYCSLCCLFFFSAFVCPARYESSFARACVSHVIKCVYTYMIYIWRAVMDVWSAERHRKRHSKTRGNGTSVYRGINPFRRTYDAAAAATIPEHLLHNLLTHTNTYMTRTPSLKLHISLPLYRLWIIYICI